MRNLVHNLKIVIPTLVFVSISSTSSIAYSNQAPTDFNFNKELSVKNELFMHSETVSEPWWNYYHDEVLNDLIDQGLKKNLDILKALENVEMAKSRYGLSKSEARPTVDLEASSSRGKSVGSDSIDDNHNAGVAANWELDLFSRAKKRNAIMKTNLSLTKDDLFYTQLIIINEIAEAYFLARASEDKIQLKQQFVDNQLVLVELIQAMVDDKRESVDKLSRAKAELVRNTIELNKEIEWYSIYQNRLAVLLGEQPGYWTIPERKSGVDSNSSRMIAIGDVSTLILNRPDVRKAEKAIKVRKLNKQLTRLEYLPHLNVTGFLGFSSNSVDQLGEDSTKTWAAGTGLSWNVLDFGRIKKQLQVHEAEEDRSILAYKQTILRALEETENSLQTYTTLAQQYGLRETQFRHIEASFEAEQIRYEEGLGSYLDVLLAKRELMETRIFLVDDFANQRLATARLYKSLAISNS